MFRSQRSHQFQYKYIYIDIFGHSVYILKSLKTDPLYYAVSNPPNVTSGDNYEQTVDRQLTA